MSGQMCWLPTPQANEENILHLRTHSSEDWRPYKAFIQYAVPDYEIPGSSKGWATYQKLLRSGWTLVPATQANKRFVLSR
ncbi:hypothetical protein [Gloeocapsopsis dulcis]|uniref:Uncharacterized protein n=1 Tax=Gloeocapsopsis dulcis AAB1 = 1H9 TaxID=1433147 RepID=A0A6N8FYI6_9CHRO|nr:hypothetical protein [Gloeocapsopsis dulcis]MUL37197.1 hypothetical protein [Gloeocapsopsis dulcis AAB1 = 1H9]WNN90192.1 hypothetical protein P0S91_03575 [Gloeocapsopsis dulcis]